LTSAIETVLVRQHYPAGEETAGGSFKAFSFFPDEILLDHPLKSATELKKTVKSARTEAEANRSTEIKIRHVAKRGPRRKTDVRAMEFANVSAKQAAEDRNLGDDKRATKTSLDGTALDELVAMLMLPKSPKRIECYDISHTHGEVAVGSCVVFIDGKPSPKLYRKFNIKTVEGIDDYASLEEVLSRRFNHVWVNGEGGLVDEQDPWAMPDLVVIDGGVGQLGAAIKGMASSGVYPHINMGQDTDDDVVEEDVLIGGLTSSEVAGNTSRMSSVPICALAKRNEEVFVYGKSGPVNSVPDSAALLLLRSLRDESHRFALNAHRKRRSAKLMK
jgi:excinuclease ABC subunit C